MGRAPQVRTKAEVYAAPAIPTTPTTSTTPATSTAPATTTTAEAPQPQVRWSEGGRR